MDWAGSVLGDGRQMFRGAVTFVFRKGILRPARVRGEHEPIARDFGEHTRSGDGITPRITFHNRRLRHAQGFDGAAIHERVRRERLQFTERFIHRAMRGFQDIDDINDLRAHLGHAELDLGAMGDEFKEVFALGFGELFGIVQPGEFDGQPVFGPARRQDRGGGDDGAGEWAAPGLIDAGDAREAALPQRAFEFKAVGWQHNRYGNQLCAGSVAASIIRSGDGVGGGVRNDQRAAEENIFSASCWLKVESFIVRT